MVICKKCGCENKFSGLCKQCGTLNAQKISLAQLIKSMNTKQKVLGLVIALIHLASAVFIAIGSIISLVDGINTINAIYEKSGDSLSFAVSVTLSIFIGIIALALAAMIVFFAYKTITQYGIFANILQGYWIFVVVFSVYAIGAINYELFIATFFIGIVISLLLIMYRKYEFSN